MSNSMTNPFDNETGSFSVLENSEGQCSLWPDFITVPAGWSATFGPGKKVDCLAFINEHWTDISPKNIR